MKQHIPTVLLLIVLLTTSIYGQPATLVVTDQLTELEFQDQITLIGRTRAIISSKIVAEVAGRIQSVDATEGVSINADSALISIDPERTELNYRSKEAQKKKAKAESVLAHSDLERAKELFEQSLISQSGLDSAIAGSTTAHENYLQLEAEANQLKLDLNNCVIRAPFDGFTVRQLADVGEWVNIGDPVFEMVDLSRVKVTVDLPEKHFGNLKSGSLAAIIVSSDNENPIIGRVTGIAPNASEATHTFPVIIMVDNQDGRLAGGMLVRATLNLSKSFRSLAVSKDAIVRQGPQTMIYTVAESKAVPIPVTISSTNGDMIAVAGPGLTVGMPIVVRGNERIYPGSSVMVEGEAEQAGSGDKNADDRESVEKP